jgi:hypothetical protein
MFVTGMPILLVVAGSGEIDPAALLSIRHPFRFLIRVQRPHRSLAMTSNKLLIALVSGIFATGAYAQTSNGGSSNAETAPTASMQGSDGASAPMTKKAKRKHMSKGSSTGESASSHKTPADTASASAAEENGQGK